MVVQRHAVNRPARLADNAHEHIAPVTALQIPDLTAKGGLVRVNQLGPSLYNQNIAERSGNSISSPTSAAIRRRTPSTYGAGFLVSRPIGQF
jgi:hypothetical protein